MRFVLRTALVLGALAATACGPAEVFYSPNTDPNTATPNAMVPVATLQANGPTVQVPVYIRSRGMMGNPPVLSAAADRCSGNATAVGVELCFWQVELRAENGAEIVSFTPGPGVLSRKPDNSLVVANGGVPLAPTGGVEQIGIAQVRATTPESIVRVRKVQSVSSLLEVVSSSDVTVARVPAPPPMPMQP